VSNLSGSCPDLRFVVDDVTITTSAATDFKKSCDAMRNGREVDVKARRWSDGSVRADRVDIKGGDGDLIPNP
jgi:Domain of unknown function (DUF5666)